MGQRMGMVPPCPCLPFPDLLIERGLEGCRHVPKGLAMWRRGREDSPSKGFLIFERGEGGLLIYVVDVKKKSLAFKTCVTPDFSTTST